VKINSIVVLYSFFFFLSHEKQKLAVSILQIDINMPVFVLA